MDDDFTRRVVMQQNEFWTRMAKYMCEQTKKDIACLKQFNARYNDKRTEQSEDTVSTQ